MKFTSTRLVASDIKAMVGFYEMVTGQTAEWLAPVFAEIVTPSAALAIGSIETVALFKEGSAEAAANRTAILEFMVDRRGRRICAAERQDRGGARAESDAVGQPDNAIPRPRGHRRLFVYASYGRRQKAVRVAIGCKS